MQRARALFTSRPFSSRRRYSTEKPRTPHAQWYSDVLPAMIPITLLGSAIYLALQLAHTRLSHEKYLVETQERVERLEAQIESLQQTRESDAKHATNSTSNTSNRWHFW